MTDLSTSFYQTQGKINSMFMTIIKTSVSKQTNKKVRDVSGYLIEDTLIITQKIFYIETYLTFDWKIP